jgi:GMP synthase-like glutamine amidotransferase
VARLLVVVPSETDPPGRLGSWLTGAGLVLDERHPGRGDALPETLEGAGGLLVLGGPGAPADAVDGGLDGVRALLRAAIAADVPTLAIGLGAELLAEVGGGAVRPAEEKPEVGATLVAKRDAAYADPVFGPLPLSPDVIAWHHDEIATLPPGATLLASNPHSPHQAFRLGERVYGLQFHIGTTPGTVRAWAARDPLGVAAAPVDAEALCARADAVDDDLAATWAPFAARFADLVRAHAPQAA